MIHSVRIIRVIMFLTTILRFYIKYINKVCDPKYILQILIIVLFKK